MSDALLHTISNVLVLVLTAGIGWLAAQTGKLDDTGRITTAKIVNLSIPFFLFNSVTTKFTHDQLVELLGMAWLPFVTVCLNLLISLALIRLGLVRRELSGTFTAAFTGSTVLFVGVPMTTALFGEEGIPYLLVYFFANCVFIWTVSLYAIQTDGVAKTGGARPKLVFMKSVRMLFSPPLLSFIVGIAFVVLSIPIPHFVAATVKSFGSVTSPLALFFIGMTIFKIGVSEMKRMPRELVFVLLSCFMIRPLVMYLVTIPFDLEPIMRKVFVAAAALPVSSVIAVLARTYGGDERFASRAIGVTTLGIIPALPVMLFIVHFV